MCVLMSSVPEWNMLLYYTLVEGSVKPKCEYELDESFLVLMWTKLTNLELNLKKTGYFVKG